MMILSWLSKQTIKLFSKFTILPQRQIEYWRIEYPVIDTKSLRIPPVSISNDICSNISKIVISDNLLLTFPEIFERYEPFQIIETYQPYEKWSLNLLSIYNYSYLLSIDFPKILDGIDFFVLQSLNISENLFQLFSVIFNSNLNWI